MEKQTKEKKKKEKDYVTAGKQAEVLLTKEGKAKRSQCCLDGRKGEKRFVGMKAQTRCNRTNCCIRAHGEREREREEGIDKEQQ